MNDFELSERKHIEGVIEKAEKGALPFVIKVTNADTVREDLINAGDKDKCDSIVNQTTSNTNESKESVYGESKILLGKPVGNTSLSERLSKEQNEETIGDAAKETNVTKVELESNLDAKADVEKTGGSEVNYEISDAEMEHIRKVTEEALMMGADNQWIGWPNSDQKIFRNLQSMIATSSFEIRKHEVENSNTNEANSVGDINSFQETPNLESVVIKTNPFERGLNKEKFATTSMEGIKISQIYGGLEKKRTEAVTMPIEESERGIKGLEGFEKPISEEVRENKIVNLTDEELEQINLVSERPKQLEKSKEFNIFTLEETKKYKYGEIQDTLIDEEELRQAKIAERWVKEHAVDRTFLYGSKINKQKEEKDEYLIKYELLQANASEEQELRVQEIAIVENPKENKGINLPKSNGLISAIEGKAKHLQENGLFEQKEMETVQDQTKENNILTEEELAQIRAVERRAKQMEEFFIFEAQAAKVFEEEERKDLDLATNRQAIEEKLQNHLTEENLEHVKVERNGICQFETPLLERFSTKDDITAKVNQVELQQKDTVFGGVTFNKFASVLNPFKKSVIMTLPFKSNVDEAKLSQNITSAKDVSKTKQQIVGESVETINNGKAYPENQNFKTDIPTINATDYAYNTEVLETTKDLASVRTTDEYLENHNLEYISSSESSDFGPGSSDEDEEIDQNCVKSFDLFPETISSTPEFKGDIDFPEAKRASTKYDIIKSIEVMPNPIHAEFLPNSRTEVYDNGIPHEQIFGVNSPSLISGAQVSVQLSTADSVADEQTVNKFSEVTEKEVDHIRMIGFQAEPDNAKYISEVSMHNDENSKIHNHANFLKKTTMDTEECEPQEKESSINAREPKAFDFINIADKERSDMHVHMETIGSEEDMLYDTSQMSPKRFAANDKFLDESDKRDLRAVQGYKLLQSTYAEHDNEVKSLEEFGREANTGKWYEERLSLLRNSLCIEETHEIPGFDLNLYTLTIINTKETFSSDSPKIYLVKSETEFVYLKVNHSNNQKLILFYRPVHLRMDWSYSSNLLCKKHEPNAFFDLTLTPEDYLNVLKRWTK